MEDKKVTIDEFTKEFSYGFLGVREREGEYVERVANFLNKYSEPQHALIMDLLDLQWVAYVQQLWFIGDETGSPDVGKNHFALARLQINANIRAERGLPDRNMRNEMMRVEYCDVLRMLENAERRQGTRTYTNGRVEKGIWQIGKWKPWWKFW